MRCELCYKTGNRMLSAGRGDQCGCMVPTLVSLSEGEKERYNKFTRQHYNLQEENRALRHLLMDMQPHLSNYDIDRLLANGG